MSFPVALYIVLLAALRVKHRKKTHSFKKKCSYWKDTDTWATLSPMSQKDQGNIQQWIWHMLISPTLRKQPEWTKRKQQSSVYLIKAFRTTCPHYFPCLPYHGKGGGAQTVREGKGQTPPADWTRGKFADGSATVHPQSKLCEAIQVPLSIWLHVLFCFP